MKIRYKLSKLFPEGKTFRVNYLEGSTVRVKNVRFESGATYETEDEALIKSIKSLHQRFPDSKSNREWLDSVGVAYELVPCMACGGRVLKLEVKHFEYEEV